MDSYRKAFWGTLLCELETHARTHALVKASFSYSHILCQTYSPVGTWCQTPSLSRHVPAEWKMNLKRVNNAYLDIARKWDTFFRPTEKRVRTIIYQMRKSMVCAPVRSIIPTGDYLSVQAHKPCSFPHLYTCTSVDCSFYKYLY